TRSAIWRTVVPATPVWANISAAVARIRSRRSWGSRAMASQCTAGLSGSLPFMGDRRRRLALGSALFALAVAGWITLVALHPHVYWQQTDTQVYRQAGAAVLHDRDLYRLAFGPAQLPFTYPPSAAPLFAAASALPFAAWQFGLAVAGIAGLLVSGWCALRLAGRASPGGALLIAAVAMWLEPVDMTLHFGQINLLLLALVLADLALPRR